MNRNRLFALVCALIIVCGTVAIIILGCRIVGRHLSADSQRLEQAKLVCCQIGTPRTESSSIHTA